MPYVTPEQIQTAKRMDLLTYLQNYNPQELVLVYPGMYCTRTHDSLKISNGKWCWFSQGIGGRSALDYLIKVEGYKFTEAVEILSSSNNAPVVKDNLNREIPKRKLMLPPKNIDNKTLIGYLKYRGINEEIINYCIRNNLLYEDEKHHNIIFVGYDSGGVARYGTIRGTKGIKFLGEVLGSDKHFSFFIPSEDKSDTVHVFESAIDLLSFATILKINGETWQQNNLLSLSGIFLPKRDGQYMNIPKALDRYLAENKGIIKICLHLDNDEPGRAATKALINNLQDKYLIENHPPGFGKDVNDTLRTILKNNIKDREDAR